MDERNLLSKETIQYLDNAGLEFLEIKVLPHDLYSIEWRKNRSDVSHKRVVRNLQEVNF